MKLLVIRLVAEVRCTRCGQLGYCEQKTILCCACLNIGLLRYGRRRREARRIEYGNFKPPVRWWHRLLRSHDG